MMRRVNREVGDGDGFSIMVKKARPGVMGPFQMAELYGL